MTGLELIADVAEVSLAAEQKTVIVTATRSRK